MLERAERLHRQFFQPGFAGPRIRQAGSLPSTSSRPNRELWIIAALPGVEPEDLDVSVDVDELMIAGVAAAARGATWRRDPSPGDSARSLRAPRPAAGRSARARAVGARRRMPCPEPDQRHSDRGRSWQTASRTDKAGQADERRDKSAAPRGRAHHSAGASGGACFPEWCCRSPIGRPSLDRSRAGGVRAGAIARLAAADGRRDRGPDARRNCTRSERRRRSSATSRRADGTHHVICRGVRRFRIVEFLSGLSLPGRARRGDRHLGGR